MPNDFSQGPVWKRILQQALPLMLAAFVQLLYNVVDRIYIGHLPRVGAIALTGIGLTFPIPTLVLAFTYLFATGGAPLFAMARGAKETDRARRLQGATTVLLLICSVVLFLFCFFFRRPILYLFGASDRSFPYADQYISYYLFGTPFVMFSTGLNFFINAQGFPRKGMMTTVIGAILNLILDPIFIFLFGMGVRGAAIATVISQLVSAVWVFHFVTGKEVLIPLRREDLRLKGAPVRSIISLGFAGFIQQATNCLAQIVCNVALARYGGAAGDLYIGIMTVVNSVREILQLPIYGLTGGAQPVMSFNYGAKDYRRVRDAVKFTLKFGFLYTLVSWLIVLAIPHLLMSIFTSDPAVISTGQHSLRVYFIGFIFMAFQYVGQACFTSMGCAKRAVFFSLFRKAILVTPLAFLLPLIPGIGVDGVFLSESISSLVGGLACITTMYFTLYRRVLMKEPDRLGPAPRRT